MPLTPSQRRYLNSLGHHLSPIVQVGKDGLTEGVVAALEQALLDHELVKVRLGTNVVEDRHQLADELAKASRSDLTQIVGNTMLLYKAHPDKPTIKLPRK